MKKFIGVAAGMLLSLPTIAHIALPADPGGADPRDRLGDIAAFGH